MGNPTDSVWEEWGTLGNNISNIRGNLGIFFTFTFDLDEFVWLKKFSPNSKAMISFLGEWYIIWDDNLDNPKVYNLG